MIGFVCSFVETNVDHCYHFDIQEQCIKNNIPFYLWGDISNKLSDLIDKNEYDVAIAIGWRYLLPINIFNELKYKLIVYHDSILPRYRGFAPLPTALINGDSEIGATVLFASKDVDAGDIILQEKVATPTSIYINEAINLIADLYCSMTLKLLMAMEEDKDLVIKKQKSKDATYSAWRGIDDCQIDWVLDSSEIYNLIRAVGRPYPGAFTYIGSRKINIWKAELIKDIHFEKRYPGKIWSLENGYPIVICGKGIIKLLDVECEGRSIIPFKKLRITFSKKQC